MTDEEKIDLRLECLRIAIEFGTQRDMMEPDQLAEKYYKWVVQGSDNLRPVDNSERRKPDAGKKARSVRKGSTPQLV
tara:strand:+ start:179 stop:409 length:231 start_codon:yes stop_codon:yes gene_type:complete